MQLGSIDRGGSTVDGGRRIEMTSGAGGRSSMTRRLTRYA